MREGRGREEGNDEGILQELEADYFGFEFEFDKRITSPTAEASHCSSRGPVVLLSSLKLVAERKKKRHALVVAPLHDLARISFTRQFCAYSTTQWLKGQMA